MSDVVEYLAEYIHDPDARLDYTWDWSLWLVKSPADTIASATVTVDVSSAQASAASISGGKVTSFITTSDSCDVTCHIVTAAGREDDRTIYLNVQER